jgi:hypothetical protein
VCNYQLSNSCHHSKLIEQLNSYGTTALNEFYGLPAFHVLDATLKGLHNVTVYNLHWKKTTDLSSSRVHERSIKLFLQLRKVSHTQLLHIWPFELPKDATFYFESINYNALFIYEEQIYKERIVTVVLVLVAPLVIVDLHILVGSSVDKKLSS